MDSKVMTLRVPKRTERLSVSPAQFYQFRGEPESPLMNDCFLEKAAAFQEIRDCLVAADNNQLSPHEAERRIQYYTRSYLGLI